MIDTIAGIGEWVMDICARYPIPLAYLAGIVTGIWIAAIFYFAGRI